MRVEGALGRLLPRIKKTYPQLRFILALDSLYGCGPLFALARKFGWSFVVTFKEGRTAQALWQEFSATGPPACPENVLLAVGGRTAAGIPLGHAAVLRGQ